MPFKKVNIKLKKELLKKSNIGEHSSKNDCNIKGILNSMIVVQPRHFDN